MVGWGRWAVLLFIFFDWVNGYGYDKQGKLAVLFYNKQLTVCVSVAQGVLCYPQNAWLPPMKHISGGATKVCGIEESGRPRCWDSVQNATSRPQSPMMYESLNCGAYHACGVVKGNQISCFGSNAFGQSDPPDVLIRSTEVSCGFRLACRVTVEGALSWWGWQASEESNRASPPQKLAFKPYMFSIVGVSNNGGCASDYLRTTLLCWLAGNVYTISTGAVSAIAFTSTGGYKTQKVVCVLTEQLYIRCWIYTTGLEVTNNITIGQQFVSLAAPVSLGSSGAPHPTYCSYMCGLLLSETEVLCWSDNNNVLKLKVKDGGLHVAPPPPPPPPPSPSPPPPAPQSLPSPPPGAATSKVPSENKSNIRWWHSVDTICAISVGMLVIIFVSLLVWFCYPVTNPRGDKYIELSKLKCC